MAFNLNVCHSRPIHLSAVESNVVSLAAHMVMWVMSDRGVPRSYRMIQGFGVNTYSLYKKDGELHYVKFHLIPELGVHSLSWDEALKINGQDPGRFLPRIIFRATSDARILDFHRKDLYEAIESGCPAKWKFCIQTIPQSKEHDFEFDILDATKLWPEELVPLEEIGELVLDRNPQEYFPEVEQVAFCTSHVVPGIGFRCVIFFVSPEFLLKSYFSATIPFSKAVISLTSTLKSLVWVSIGRRLACRNEAVDFLMLTVPFLRSQSIALFVRC